MLIQCTIKRQGGSRVTLGDQRYHFAPDDLGRHVAEVTDEAHIARLLSISAYVALGDDAPVAAAATDAARTLTPQEPHDADTTDDGRDAGVQGAQDGDLPAAGQGDDPAGEGAAQDGQKAPEDVELEAAREAYREAFGKAAHPRAHASTLWQRIEEGNA